MPRDIATEPHLFCAFYEPMIGRESADPARLSAASLKRIGARSRSALRLCLAYFR